MRDLWLTILAQWNAFVAAIKDARAPTQRGADDTVIYVRQSDGPVVESRDIKTPLPLRNVPIRSTKATAKRLAHRFAEQHAKRTLSPAAADRYLAKLVREHPDLVMEVNPDEADALEYGGVQTYRARGAS